jgi:arabinose-5-phosphate isomerase
MGHLKSDLTDAAILSVARQTLEIEIDALQQLRTQLGDSFVDCVRAVHQTDGRLIVTGIGKSAIIAQKIVATMNSTGTQAIFMHAADAIHGDLGLIGESDLVLVLSKSGETPEIKALVPLIRHFGNPIIAMVANPESFLGRQADFVLVTPVSQEAEPNNLAPTASTTAQVALGDALATALMALNGFTQEDFARFHPGGSLGKTLLLTAGDLMKHNERPAVRPDTPIRQVIIEITSKRLGATVVTDEHGVLLGIITDGDLRRMLEKPGDASHFLAKDIMSANPKHVLPEELAVRALGILEENSITHIIVADESRRYLGMIHFHDFLREGLL